MAGLGGAVKIQHRHAEDAGENFFVNVAKKFVGAENEFQRGKFDAATLAVKREPDDVNRVGVEKLRRPLDDFLRHALHFGVRQHERDALEIDEERAANDALLARHPDGGTSEAVAGGRGDGGAAGFRKLIQSFGGNGIQSQCALFLRVPPAARENYG